MEQMPKSSSSSTALVMTPEQFLAHWQGHRALTRRMIAAFPDDKLFTYSIGGMRPFSVLALECLGMGVPTLNGVITREWKEYKSPKVTTNECLLRARGQA